MEPWQWAVLLKPLGALALFATVVYPLRRAIMRVLPDSPITRFLGADYNHPGTHAQKLIAFWTVIGVYVAIAIAVWVMGL